MAKKDAFEQFLAEILDTVPDDRKGAFEETLKSDKVAAALKERVMARSDYSRSKDELDTRVNTFNTEVQEAQRRIAGWNDWYRGVAEQEAGRKAQLETYESLYGKIDGTNASKAPKYTTPDDVTKTVADLMQQRDAAAIQFADVLTDMKIDYKDKFGKRLDTQSLLKMAGEQGLPLQVAYDRFISPDVEAHREKDIEVRIAKAKDEARKEALSSSRMPYQSGPLEPHVLDAPADVPKNSHDRIAAAIADWNTTEHGGLF